jgi:hypothetical protein
MGIDNLERSPEGTKVFSACRVGRLNHRHWHGAEELNRQGAKTPRKMRRIERRDAEAQRKTRRNSIDPTPDLPNRRACTRISSLSYLCASASLRSIQIPAFPWRLGVLAVQLPSPIAIAARRFRYAYAPPCLRGEFQSINLAKLIHPSAPGFSGGSGSRSRGCWRRRCCLRGPGRCA